MKKAGLFLLFVLFLGLNFSMGFSATKKVITNGDFENGSGTSATGWSPLNFGGSGPVARLPDRGDD